MRLYSLCNAARALYPAAEVRFMSVPEKDAIWKCVITVGGVIIIESDEGTLDHVLNNTASRVKNMSLSIRSYIDEGEVSSDASPKKP